MLIHVHDDHGSRVFRPEDFPLDIGGDAADVRLQGVDAVFIARLGFEAGVPFVSPGDSPGRINGDRLDQSRWLGDGDIAVFDQAHIVCRLRPDAVTLHVRSRATGQTVPPDDEAVTAEIIEPVAFHPERGVDAATHGSTRLLQGAVVALFVVLGAVAWFMFTARSVNVLIAPEPESVSIAGTILKPRVGGRYLLRPGKYEVQAQRSGYEQLRAPVTVGRSGNQQFVLQMTKLPGLLTLHTGELTGAEVVVDGEVIGVTPLDQTKVPAGLHRLLVRAVNHLPHEQEIDIEGMEKTQTLEVSLQPNWAPVSIATTPPGATVTLADTQLGETPLTAQLEAGERVLAVSLPGYQRVERLLQVVAGEPLQVAPIQLVEADGRVTVSSKPAGANVTVDGVFRGRTPLDLALRPAARHRIVVARPGYASASRTVTLEPEEHQTMQMSMTPILGTLRIIASPADAQLLIDGRDSGGANQTLSLTTAPHTIEVRKSGYASHVETVTPRSGLEQKLTIILQTTAEAQAAVLSKEITTTAGQMMRLIPVGSLRMGSPRREQGRRSNELQRDVELTREFYISETEVTNAQFRQFMTSHSSGFVGGLSLDADEQPVVRISWQQAARYCNWLSEKEGLPLAYQDRDGRMVAKRPMTTGYRLPTEAEWSWVARYAGGTQPRKYVWGDTLPPPSGTTNVADNAARNLAAARLANYDDGFSVSASVGSFPANPLGLRDLGGNVSEWMHDFYEASPIDPYLSQVDTMGPESGNRHVIRGASWMQGGISELRAAYRDHGLQGREDVGFRLARYAR